MKTRKKAFLSIVLTLALALSLCVGTGSAAYAEDLSWDSGSCKVTLNDEGLMTVSGDGGMVDYTGNVPTMGGQPWGNVKESVKSLVVEEGVTGLGACAFCYHGRLSTVTLPSTLKSIGDSAFSGCNLSSVFLNATTPPDVSQHAFSSFHSEDIYVPHDSVQTYRSHEIWGNPEKFAIHDATDYLRILEDVHAASAGNAIKITAEAAPESDALTWSVTRNDPQVTLYSDEGCTQAIGEDYTGKVVYAKSVTYGPAAVKVEKVKDSTQCAEYSLSFSPVVEVQPAGAGKVSVYPDWDGSTKWCAYMAEAAQGYVFDKWTYDSEGVDDEKLTVKRHTLLYEDGPLQNVVAHFRPKDAPEGSTAVTVEPQASGIAYWEKTEIGGVEKYRYVAVPAEGYEFLNWTYMDQYGDEPEQEYTTSDNPFNEIPADHDPAKDMVAHFKTVQKEQAVAAPVAATGLTYTGEAQKLITPAVVTDGNKKADSVVYLLDEEGASWSEEIPTATDAGVYKVRFKVHGNDEYYTYYETEPVTVEIAPVEPQTPSGLTAKAGQMLSEVSLPDNWAWVDGAQIIGETGTNTYQANYTAPDNNHISKSNVDVTIEVAGAVLPKPSLNTDDIVKGAKVYMGTRYADGKEAPISWIVLGDPNSEDLKDGDTAVEAANARLMITEKTQHEMQFNGSGTNPWKGSDIQAWCNEAFLDGSDSGENGETAHFSAIEKAAVLATAKTDTEYHSDMYGTANLENEKMFLLSVQEIREGGYFEEGAGWSAKKYGSDDDAYWWLRTPYTGYGPTNHAYGCMVTRGGYSTRSEGHVNVSTYGARPACNFNLNAVLFTTQVPGTENEYKLTLKDADLSIAVGDEGAKRTGNTITVPYGISGANAANANQVLVLVTDKELADSDATVLQCAALNTDGEFTATGTGTFELDEGITGTCGNDYHVYILAEDANGIYGADFASEPVEVVPTIVEEPADDPVKTSPASIAGQKLVLAKASATFNNKVLKPAVKTVGGKALKAGTDYTMTVKNSKGKVVTSPKAAGKYTVTVAGKGNYTGVSEAATFTILKAKNPLKVKKGKAVKISKKKVAKKAQKRKVTKAIKFAHKGQGKRIYKLVSAKKGKKSFKKRFKISKTTGKLTAKKGLKKGTYKVKVKVKALGNSNYKPSTWKTVTFKVKVK